MLFLDFIFLGVRFKVFDSFWGSVVDHKGGLVSAPLRSGPLEDDLEVMRWRRYDCGERKEVKWYGWRCDAVQVI
jgi:hypothetical protein